MSIEERKARLVGIILQTQEPSLIGLLEEDVAHYQQKGVASNVDDLSPDEIAELGEIMEEPAEKDTISYEAFKTEMAKWRNDLL